MNDLQDYLEGDIATSQAAARRIDARRVNSIITPVNIEMENPPWCPNCGSTQDFVKPQSRIQKKDNAITPPVVDSPDFYLKARLLVMKHFNDRADKTDGGAINVEDVYLVWFSRTLQNWKALVITTVPDGMYYEVTYNGDKQETYLDAYKQFENVCIPDD